METFQQAGLQVDVLEINSFALIRTIREYLRQFSSNEAAVIVDIEFDNTEIAIVVDGVPQFSRTVPIGTFQLQNALSRAMNLPTSRSPEILLGMTLLLAGPGGGLAQLDEYFTQRLSVPTMAIDPIASLNLDTTQEIPNTEKPGLGTVLGLGLRGI